MSRWRWSNPVRADRRPVVGLILVLLSIPASCGLWLTFGYDNGTLEACDTFNADL